MPPDWLGERIIGAAIAVHKELGPGLLESTYEACLAMELQERGLIVSRQKVLPVRYKTLMIDQGYRVDLLVEDSVVLELKSIEAVLPLHKAQLLSYLRLGGYRLGYLLNFNVRRLADGLHRLVN